MDPTVRPVLQRLGPGLCGRHPGEARRRRHLAASSGEHRGTGAVLRRGAHTGVLFGVQRRPHRGQRVRVRRRPPLPAVQARPLRQPEPQPLCVVVALLHRGGAQPVAERPPRHRGRPAHQHGGHRQHRRLGAARQGQHQDHRFFPHHHHHRRPASEPDQHRGRRER